MLTQTQIAEHFAAVVGLVQQLCPGELIRTSDWQNYGWTRGVAVLPRLKVIEVHAWSWDGVFDPKVIETFLADPTKRGVVLHLSDPEMSRAPAVAEEKTAYLRSKWADALQAANTIGAEFESFASVTVKDGKTEAIVGIAAGNGNRGTRKHSFMLDPVAITSLHLQTHLLDMALKERAQQAMAWIADPKALPGARVPRDDELIAPPGACQCFKALAADPNARIRLGEHHPDCPLYDGGR